MQDTTPLEIVTFEPWADPVVEHLDIDPTDNYSRIAWLPILGPTSWVILGTITTQLADEASVTWKLEDLAEAHGIGGHLGRSTSILARTLKRLNQFGFIRATDHGIVLVRTKMPPLTHRQLRRSASHVSQLHQDIFGHTAKAE
jgi:hypothetical protein